MPPIYKPFLLLFCFGWIFYNCSPVQSTAEKTEKSNPNTLSEADADDLLIQMSTLLIPNPEGQKELENNVLVNFAIDSLFSVVRASSGLFYQVLDPGQGEKLQWGDRITAHYQGTFLDGRIFDSSYRKGEPLSFYIGNMIAGWNEGLQLVAPGGSLLLLVPSHLGYQEEGLQNKRGQYLIPPNSPLIFRIEVVGREEE